MVMQTELMPDLSTLRPGDPVKIAGRGGNYRFLGFYREQHAEVIGPVSDEGGNSRIVKLTALRKAPKGVTRTTVAPSAIQLSTSAMAHKEKRG